MEIIFAVLGVLVLLAFALSYGTLSWGLVLYKFWYWFLLPVFPGLTEITFVQAIGLVFVVSLFHTVNTQIIKKEYKDETNSVVNGLLAPWLTLFLGWLVKIILM